MRKPRMKEYLHLQIFRLFISGFSFFPEAYPMTEDKGGGKGIQPATFAICNHIDPSLGSMSPTHLGHQWWKKKKKKSTDRGRTN